MNMRKILLTIVTGVTLMFVNHSLAEVKLPADLDQDNNVIPTANFEFEKTNETNVTKNQELNSWNINKNGQRDVGDLVIVGNHFGENVAAAPVAAAPGVQNQQQSSREPLLKFSDGYTISRTNPTGSFSIKRGGKSFSSKATVPLSGVIQIQNPDNSKTIFRHDASVPYEDNDLSSPSDVISETVDKDGSKVTVFKDGNKTVEFPPGDTTTPPVFQKQYAFSGNTVIAVGENADLGTAQIRVNARRNGSLEIQDNRVGGYFTAKQGEQPIFVSITPDGEVTGTATDNVKKTGDTVIYGSLEKDGFRVTKNLKTGITHVMLGEEYGGMEFFISKGGIISRRVEKPTSNQPSPHGSGSQGG